MSAIMGPNPAKRTEPPHTASIKHPSLPKPEEMKQAMSDKIDMLHQHHSDAITANNQSGADYFAGEINKLHSIAQA